MENPVTPQPKARNLWPSPSFSDYFSGEDDTNSPTPANALADKVTPGQRRLLHRLNDIGNQVLRIDINGETPDLIDNELDALERRLNAPESQTRAPAELADSGLFVDDESEEDLKEEAENARIAEEAKRNAELLQGKEVVDRISKVTEQLQERYEEVKRVNEKTTALLTEYSNENDTLRNENVKLKSENDAFQQDLSDIYSAMMGIKMEIKATEVLESESGNSLRKGIEKWKQDWKGIETRLAQRRYLSGRKSRGSSSASSLASESGANGMSSSMHTPLRITRPGLMSHPESDPFVEENTSPNQDEDAEELDEETVVDDATEGAKRDQPPTGEDPEDSQDSEPEPPPRKTPWQELWDSLGEYAGILDYNEDD